MYFTQEKNPNLRVCTLSWHWLLCLCIRLHTGGLSDIMNWWYYFTYFFYIPNFLPKQWKLLLWDWVEWKFILLWVPYTVYCSFGWKIPVNFLAVTMNQYLGPPIAQLISASHIKTAPSCIRELVNEWCNGNWLWRLNWVTLLRHHHNKHWITERKQNTRQSKTSYVSVINVCTKVMSCDIEKCDTCVTWS